MTSLQRLTKERQVALRCQSRCEDGAVRLGGSGSPLWVEVWGIYLYNSCSWVMEHSLLLFACVLTNTHQL